MARGSTQTASSVQKARSGLDEALSRLEKVIDSRPADTAGNETLAKELATATTEIDELKGMNQTVSARLDRAIGQLKELLKDG